MLSFCHQTPAILPGRPAGESTEIIEHRPKNLHFPIRKKVFVMENSLNKHLVKNKEYKLAEIPDSVIIALCLSLGPYLWRIVEWTLI